MSAIPVVPPSPTSSIACGIVFPIVSGIAVALRFYCRRIQRAQLLIDDWLTIPSWIFVTGMSVCLVLGVYRKGFAYPSPMPPPGTDPATFLAPEIVINRKLEYAIEVMQFPAITCIKLSFLFFYKRIFSTPSTPILRTILWAMIAICAAWGIVYFFTFVFVCGTHVSAMWSNPMIFKQHCSRIVNENYWLAITDFVLDAIIFIIPIPLIWKLQLSLTRKFALLTIFSVGAVTLAASITRMVVFIHALKVLRQAYKSSGTNNLMVTIGMYWTIFESGMGLIVACMPAIYVLIKRFLEAHFDFRTSPSRNGYSWTWRTTARSQSERFPHGSDVNTSEVEFVRLGAVGGIVDTKIGHEDKESEGNDGHEGGIMVVKTVRRTEDMI